MAQVQATGWKEDLLQLTTQSFSLCLSPQAFNSGRVEVGGQATSGMQGLGFSGSNLPPAASGRVGVLGGVSTWTFPNCPWQFPLSPPAGVLGIQLLGELTQHLDADQPQAGPRSLQTTGQNGFPGCHLTSGSTVVQPGSQGAFYHQEPGFLLVEALTPQSALGLALSF